LLPFSLIYFLLGVLRRLFVKPVRLLEGAKVICVGNITVGGSGKTQIVKWLASKFTKKDISFVIITKGYGSRSSLTSAVLVRDGAKASEVGDEAVELLEYGSVISSPKILDTRDILQAI